MVTMGALPPELEFLGLFFAAIGTVVPDAPSPFAAGPPPELQVAAPSVLRTRMTEAGAAEVEVGTIDVTMPFADGDDLWDWVTTSNPLGRLIVGGLSPAQGEEVRRVLDGTP